MAKVIDELYSVVSFNETFSDYTTRIFTDRGLAEKFTSMGGGRRFMVSMPVTYSVGASGG